MPTYSWPGVYVEEVSSAVKPIAGVGTSTAAFIGVSTDISGAWNPENSEGMPGQSHWPGLYPGGCPHPAGCQ